MAPTRYLVAASDAELLSSLHLISAVRMRQIYSKSCHWSFNTLTMFGINSSLHELLYFSNLERGYRWTDLCHSSEASDHVCSYIHLDMLNINLYMGCRDNGTLIVMVHSIMVHGVCSKGVEMLKLIVDNVRTNLHHGQANNPYIPYNLYILRDFQIN